MLKRLAYKAIFEATGRTLEGSFSFKTGTTAICGPNESGKSFAVEQIRFCLFGSDALRGKKSDYVMLNAELEVSIRGVDYHIERTLNSAKISCEGTMIAVGISPVNTKVISILGFDLDVFDVACVANQSEVTRLGDMTSTDRKRLVDRTIGLDRMNELTKWVGEERLMVGREISALEKRLMEPTEPPKPAGYAPSAQLRAEVEKLRVLKVELDTIRGKLSIVKQEPERPAPPLALGTLEALEDELRQVDANSVQRSHVLSLPIVDFDPEVVRATWMAWDAWEARRAFEAQHPRPTVTREVVERDQERERRLRELSALQTARANHLRAGKADCPACGHCFALAHEHLALIDDRVRLIGAVKNPELSPGEIYAAEKMLNDWDRPETQTRWEQVKGAVPVPKPSVDRRQLADVTNEE